MDESCLGCTGIDEPGYGLAYLFCSRISFTKVGKRFLKAQRRLKMKKTFDLFIGIGIAILATTLLIAAVQTWGTTQFLTGTLLSIEPLFGMDMSVWAVVLTLGSVLLLILWLTLAFSFLALVSGLCISCAFIMLFAGFSIFWPLLLLILAAWGVAQASQAD